LIKYLKRPGFTLIEIIISVTIFSVVLILTTGIVGQSAGFQSKIAAQKEAFQQVRGISDMLSSDIRGANIGGDIEADINLDPSPILSRGEKAYTSGLAVFNCRIIGSVDNCLFVHFSKTDNGFLSIMTNYNDPSDLQTAADFNGNTLVIQKSVPETGNKSVIVYHLYDQKLYRNVFTIAKDDLFGLSDRIASIRISANQISDDDHEMTLSFGGYAPDDEGMKIFPLQPYVSYYLRARTFGYDSLKPVFRGESEIETTLASRNY